MAKSFPEYAFLLFALAIGLFLRFYQLSDQIITSDEWHAIHKALDSSYSAIASSFGVADHSIPITLYYKLLADNIGLTQWMIQLPFVATGCLAIVAIPLLIRPYLGNRVANLSAIFLAMSPILIYQSRFARPYPIAFLLAICGVIFFYNWWQTNRLKYALLYVISASLCGYFLVLNLPFVLSPFIFFFLQTIFIGGVAGNWPEKIQAIKKLFILGLGTTVPLVLLLITPVINDFSALADKSGAGSLELWQYLQVLPIFSGGGGAVITFPFMALAGFGLYCAIKRRLCLPVYLTFLSVMQVISIYIVAPLGTENVIILSRYLMLIIPVLVILATIGLTDIVALIKLRRQSLVSYTAGVAFVFLTFMLGPLPAAYYSPNNNIVLTIFSEIVFGDQIYESVLRGTPSFYADLAELPPAEVYVVQAPYYYNFDYLPLYQRQNRQEIAMGKINGLCSNARAGEISERFKHKIRLNNYFYLNDPQSLRDGGVDFVVFHTNLSEELVVPVIVNEIDLSACLNQYTQWFGPPYFEDETITVYAIDSSVES